MEFKYVTELKSPETNGTKYWNLSMVMYIDEFRVDGSLSIDCEELSENAGIIEETHAKVKKMVEEYLLSQCKEEYNKDIAKMLLA